MANTVTTTRVSSSKKIALVENDTTTLSGATYVAIIDGFDVSSYDRASIQVLANDSEGLTCQVWGTLFDSAVALPVTNSKWVQIGDDVVVEAYERASIQVLSNDEGGGLTCQVWGSLFDAAEALPVTNSKWVQIGDDVVVAVNSGAMKSIATTALRFLAVTVKATDGSATGNITAGDCKVFLQGTI